jgi:aspartokinase
MSQYRSISAVVRQVIDMDSSIQDAIEREYANYSAIARIIQPTVSRMLGKEIRVETLVTSVKRLRGQYKRASPNIVAIISQSKVNVRTDVSKISVKRIPVTRQIVRDLMARYGNRFFQLLEGITAMTIVYDRKLHARLRKLLQRRYVIDEREELAAIIITSPPGITHTPGCVNAMLQQLARRGINIEEVISCYTDTILLTSIENGPAAFDALSTLIYSCRRLNSKKE